MPNDNKTTPDNTQTQTDDGTTAKPLQLEDVLKDELIHTKSVYTSKDSLSEIFKELHNANLTALCFSGGGIRSATFGLGIVQALAKHRLLKNFDYLSTVSGGGYLGSWLSAWVCREQRTRTDDDERPDGDELKVGIGKVQNRIDCVSPGSSNNGTGPRRGNPNPEPTQLQHLREYSNYMSPKSGLLSADTWTLAAIYSRNLFLNLTIFIPLLAAVLILPRFLFQILVRRPSDPASQLWIMGIGLAIGAFALAFVISRLPSKSLDDEESVRNPNNLRKKINAFLNTDSGVLIVGVLPLLISAFLASCLWIWTSPFEAAFKQYLPFSADFGLPIDPSLTLFLVVAAAAYILGLIFFFIIKFRRAQRDVKAGLAAFVSSLVGALLLWVVVYKLRPYVVDCFAALVGSDRNNNYFLQLYLCFSVPTFLLVVLIAASLYVGLTSRPASDEDREWLARYGAWVLIVGGVWILLNAMVLLGPSFLQWSFRLDWNDSVFRGLPAAVSTVTAVVSAVVALFGGFSEKGLVRDEPVKSRTSVFLAYAPKIAAVIFLGFIFVGLAYLASLIFYLAHVVQDTYHVLVLLNVGPAYLGIFFGAFALAGLIMACFVNVNKFSLHGAYRDRLVRAYLGASNAGRKQNTFTGFDDNDNLELHELENQKPLHIINGTVNLVSGNNLAWQDRKAASFTMSPLHCGSWAVKGYRKSDEYCRNPNTGKALRLGTAMAISGAAANPNMGYYSSSVVTFLMSLFNIRLGWWLGNTGQPGSARDWFGRGKHRYFEKVGPSIAVLPLINETFGRTDENKRFLMVTDGGHFENLALYEMILRRCRLIILSDGAADFDFKFGEIANAIQKCKVDLGVDITLLGSMNILARGGHEDPKTRRSRFAIAEITYPERNANGNGYLKGWLLYTRPTYYKNEPRDIMNYADSNPKFPHQSTGDQMYDEKQFEAYRGLGHFTMMEIQRILAATAAGDPDDEVDDDLETLFAEKPDMRKVIFDFFGFSNYKGFTPRGQRPSGKPPWQSD